MKIKNTLNNCEKYTFSQNYDIMNTVVQGPVIQSELTSDIMGRSVVVKMERTNGVDSWKEVMLVYTSALKQVETKLEVLNDEFQ